MGGGIWGPNFIGVVAGRVRHPLTEGAGSDVCIPTLYMYMYSFIYISIYMVGPADYIGRSFTLNFRTGVASVAILAQEFLVKPRLDFSSLPPSLGVPPQTKNSRLNIVR